MADHNSQQLHDTSKKQKLIKSHQMTIVTYFSFYFLINNYIIYFRYDKSDITLRKEKKTNVYTSMI